MRPAPGQDQDAAENTREFLVGREGVANQDRAGTDVREQLAGGLGIAPRFYVELDRIPGDRSPQPSLTGATCWVPEYSGLKRRVCPTFPAGSFFQ